MLFLTGSKDALESANIITLPFSSDPDISGHMGQSPSSLHTALGTKSVLNLLFPKVPRVPERFVIREEWPALALT